MKVAKCECGFVGPVLKSPHVKGRQAFVQDYMYPEHLWHPTENVRIHKNFTHGGHLTELPRHLAFKPLRANLYSGRTAHKVISAKPSYIHGGYIYKITLYDDDDDDNTTTETSNRTESSYDIEKRKMADFFFGTRSPHDSSWGKA